jgi:inner membrane protein
MPDTPERPSFAPKSPSSVWKLFIIGFIILILMIPVAWISSLIKERHERQQSVVSEIAAKWGSDQIVGGPLLSIPYYVKTTNRDQTGNQTTSFRTEYLHIAPQTMQVTGKLKTSYRHRGIFKVTGYQADLDMIAEFPSSPDFSTLSVNGSELDWKNALVTFNVEDSWGIRSLSGKINSEHLTFGKSQNVVCFNSPDPDAKTLPRHSGYQNPSNDDKQNCFKLQARIPELTYGQKKTVTMSVSLTGTGKFYLLATAISQSVKLQGDWHSPSFISDLLPETRRIGKQGFEATWQTNDLNTGIRPYWHSQDPLIRLVSLGIDFLPGVDSYQQTTRTLKYCILFLLLTFMAFFFTETVTRQRIHPIQYLMVGSSLIVFYLLLLSISEHLGFGWSYLIAAAAVILQISLYSFTILKTRSFAIKIGALLTGIYAFLYVLLRLEDSALLVGSIGLFALLGIAMYLIRNINWYNQE